MTIVARYWVPAAAVRLQERGPEFIAPVDGAAWSEGHGYLRGFFSAFRLQPGKDVWFHFPLPTPVENQDGALCVASVSLLWEVLDGADIGWVTLQHGGADRFELTPRMVSPAYEPIEHVVAPEHRQYYPVMQRRLSEFTLETPLPLRFGVQLCVMVRGGDAGGTVRFYGAGAAFSAR